MNVSAQIAENPNVRALASAMGPDAWRLTPATMANRLTNGKWAPAKHLLYASTAIASGLMRGNARITVEMPPRHGKSELTSRHTSTWFLDHFPERQIILTSYGADLATRFSRTVRDDVEYYSQRGDLRVALHPTDQGVDAWSTSEGGGLLAAGVAGPITGRGAHLLTVDDYLKNAKDAASKGIRDAQWEWLISTAMTRLEPNASVLICATRWNLDDIIGRIRQSTETEVRKYPWIHIKFPAVALEADVLGRKPGDVLWPERYNLDRLHEIQLDMGGEGAYFWEALFQQEPIPRSGGLVDDSMFPIVTELPHYSHLRLRRAWDLAGSAESGDYTVGVLMAEDIRTRLTYILDVVRGRWSAAQLDQILYTIAVRDGVATQIDLEQEPGSSGLIAMEHFTSSVLKGFAAVGQRSTGDKFVRAQPFYACAQMGHLRLLRGPWNKAYIQEHKLFPDAANDDQVDASSLGYSKLNAKRYKGVTWGKDRPALVQPRPMIDITPAADTAQSELQTMLEKHSNSKAKMIVGATWR